MPGGRPTKYLGQETLDKAEEYIQQAVDSFTKGEPKVVNLPKSEGLALYLEVNHDTLYEWAKKHKEFSDILKKVNSIQAERVINQALAGNYNPLIAKLLLGKHGYSDRTDITTGGAKITGFNYTQLDETNDTTDKEAASGLAETPRQDD